MNRSRQDKLLRELLAPEEPSNFREASLQQGLRTLRHEKHRRRAVQFVALIGLPLLALAALLSRHPAPAPDTSDQQDKTVTVNSPEVDPRTPVKFISDEELFALFPRRSLALVGKPGQQQLVFLDQPASAL